MQDQMVHPMVRILPSEPIDISDWSTGEIMGLYEMFREVMWRDEIMDWNHDRYGFGALIDRAKVVSPPICQMLVDDYVSKRYVTGGAAT